MKKWPEDESKTVYYEDLIDPLIKSLFFAYNLTRKNTDKDIPYTGYDTSNSITTVGPKESLTIEGQKFGKEYGESPIKNIIGIAFRLGFEQGRRTRQETINFLEKQLKQEEQKCLALENK